MVWTGRQFERGGIADGESCDTSGGENGGKDGSEEGKPMGSETRRGDEAGDKTTKGTKEAEQGPGEGDCR